MEKERKTLNLTCFITGETMIISGNYLQKLIDTYGSRENAQKYWITSKAKSLLFKGYGIDEIRKILVKKQTELIDSKSEKCLELIKYWQDEKVKKSKYKLNSQEESSSSFLKTDDDVKGFIELWKVYNEIEDN